MIAQPQRRPVLLLISASILTILMTISCGMVEGFVVSNMLTSSSSLLSTRSTSALSMVGPLQKITNKQEYNRVVEGLMLTQGISRKEAEEEYNAYLDNPNNYALNKGEAYYKSLGYKSLMDGVIGEAEKEGRGDEVRARIEAFKKKSQLKGTAVILISTAILFYYNTVNPYTPPPHL